MMTGADKSGDDVHCESDADDVSSHDGDSDPSCYVFPDFDQLDISCSKILLIMNRVLLTPSTHLVEGYARADVFHSWRPVGCCWPLQSSVPRIVCTDLCTKNLITSFILNW
jgi:hypothetical protein